MTDGLNEQFGEIYDQNIDKIYRFVYLKVDSRDTAEDISSKVFVKGWEAFQAQSSNIHPVKSAEGGAPSGQFNRIKNPSAFLYQIARNAVIDYYRDKGRTKTVSVDSGLEITDPGLDAHNRAILNADVNTIKEAITKLKKEHQDIIIWHYLDDMPIGDIAELLGKPAGTIRVAMHRGLKELRGLIQES